MDAVNDPDVVEVVVMTSAQVGKTEILINAAGYYISQDPSPLMLFQPTIEMAEAFSKDRLAPMLRDTPIMHALIGDPRSKDSNNTLLHKTFPGGHITIAGANSPSSLASRPVRVVMFDEVDRYPASAGTEGDPVNLGKKRTNNFWNRRVLMVSTPTIKGASRIESAFNDTDQRRFFVKCLHCNDEAPLQWANVRWHDGQAETARYFCAACGAAHDDKDRARMVRGGRWLATSEASRPGLVGFHLNELYSPWRKLHEVVAEFLSAKKQPETLKTWINTSLGETWEAGQLRVAASELAKRAEPFDFGVVPHGACILTCGVDTQDDRLEFTVFGWGEGEEVWVLDYGVIPGDPANLLPGSVWDRLDARLKTPLVNVYGHEMTIAMTAIDSGGSHTQSVYQFCRSRGEYVMAIKGASVAGKPVLSRPTSQDININGATVPNGVALWLIGTDTCKHTLHGRMGLIEKGPGFFHFSHQLPMEYYHQLTAERLVTSYYKGSPRVSWVKSSGARNEALDMAVYGYAAAIRRNIHRMPPNEWQQARDYLGEPANGVKPETVIQSEDSATVAERPVVGATEKPGPVPRGRRGSGWLHGGGRRGGSWL